MPHTFVGIGTKFYGKEENVKDTSYIATKWIVFFYIPIFPIGSFQIRYAGKKDHNTSSGFQLAHSSRVPLQWLHVCNVYAFIAAMAILTSLIVNRQTTSISTAVSLSTLRPTLNKKTDENGISFPQTSGYISGYEQAFTDGATPLTIDNRKNNYDIHVKLYNLDTIPPGLARVFFVKADDQFSMGNITPGTYELRYRNLKIDRLFRTDSFELDGYTHLTLGLHGTIGGDMETYPISEEDFQRIES